MSTYVHSPVAGCSFDLAAIVELKGEQGGSSMRERSST